MRGNLIKILFLSLTIVLSLVSALSKTATQVNFETLFVIKAQDLIQDKRRSSLTSEASNNGEVTLEVKQISQSVINFIFREKDVQRFELPEEDPFPHHKKSQVLTDMETDYSFEIEKEPFSLTIKRKATDEILFTTKSFNVVFQENYAELTTILPSNNIFGLGERTTSFKIKPGMYTIYNRDAYGIVDDGVDGGKNRYGSHPMYLMREKSGNYFINYLRNSFPMDVIVAAHESEYTLTYKTTGGVLDFSIFLGDKYPETATRKYHKFLGGHTLPPFWSLGFHQCRWGYKNLEMIHDVLEKYKIHKMPLDTIWMDIDYMKEYVPFTVDEERFNIQQFKDYLTSYKKKFVMIAEPAMSIKWKDYEYLVKGIEKDLFIRNKEGKYLINRVWPGDCYFIDYFHPNTPGYWQEALDKLHEKLDFSGLWLDMNEVATFEPGQVDENDQRISCNDDTVYPYKPGNQPLERNTICPNAVHYGGRTHVQLHNYNPVMQQKLTFEFLEKKFPDQFPFILSRANAPGTNKWSFHWTGDNVGDFAFYKGSVSEVFNNNLFGMPMVGPDICGFAGNTPEILCAKFYQMGSLFPFSRSHAADDSIRKEPWMMGPTLLTTVQKSLKFRYEILKYYYSLFLINKNEGTVFRPLFYNFPEDEEVLKDQVIDNQFMIGNDLLVAPNFNNDDTTFTVKSYFPQGSWYDLRTNTKVNTQGGYVDIPAPLNEMPPVYLRGGSTIFKNTVDTVENTYDLNDDLDILIAFDNSYKKVLTSHGKIPALNNYNSKTKVTKCVENEAFIDVHSIYDLISNNLSINFHLSPYYDNQFSPLNIKQFNVYGVNLKSKKVLQTNLNDFIHFDTDEQKFLSEHISGFFPKQSLQGTNKYVVHVINDDYLIIEIIGSLKLEKGKSLQIFLNFE